MKEKSFNNVKLGLFVSIAFAIFTVSIYYIGNRQYLFGSTFQISSAFKTVNGLQIGNNVRYTGINVGNVEDLVIISDSLIRVDMVIENRVREFLKKDAVASIATDGLVGNMVVNINPGTGNMARVEDGDMIQSYSKISTDDMLSSLGNTTENIALLSLNLLEITENINSGKGSVAALINDPQIANDLQMTIQNLKNTSSNIELLSGQFRKSMNDINNGDGLLGYLLTDTTFESRVASITLSLDTLMKNQMTPIIDNLEYSTQHILSTSEDLNRIIAQIDLNEGLAGTLLKDTAAAEDLRKMLDNLNEGTYKFSENMEALKHNFLLRGYFKKQEKKRKKELEKIQKQKEKDEAESDALVLKNKL